MKKPFRFLPLFIIAVAVLLALGAGSLLESISKIPDKRILLPKALYNPTSTPIPTPKTYPYEESLGVKRALVKKLPSGGEELVYGFSDDNFTEWKYILKWKNYLFFKATKTHKMMSINLDDGQVIALYDFDRHKEEFEKVPDMGILNIGIANNLLYFQVGAYMREGATYIVNLPPSKEPVKLPINKSGRIIYTNNRYLFDSGFGDGCGGYSDYYTFNPVTLETDLITRVAIGCLAGDEYVNLDKLDRMIVAHHESTLENYQNGLVVYDQISLIPVDRPQERIIIIDKNQMPNSIRSLYYDKLADKLWLLGEGGLFYYDFVTQKLMPKSLIPGGWKKLHVYYAPTGMLCLTDVIYSTDWIPAIYDLNTDKFIDETRDCPKRKDVEYPVSYIDIKDLDLPDGYKFVE